MLLKNLLGNLAGFGLLAGMVFASPSAHALTIGELEVAGTENGTLRVKEGESQTISIALANQPSETVTLNMSVVSPEAVLEAVNIDQNSNQRTRIDNIVSINPDASLSTPNLEFTPSNYATPQQVTVSAIEDTAVEVDEEFVLFTNLIANSVVNGEVEIQDTALLEENLSQVSIIVEDNDGLNIDTTERALSEGSSTPLDLDLVFATDPTIPQVAIRDATSEIAVQEQMGSVTVNFFPDEELEVTISESEVNPVPVIISTLEDAEESAGSIQFNGGNYETVRTVSVQAVDDEEVEDTHTGTLRMTIGSDNPNIPFMEKTLEFTITDNDEAVVTDPNECEFLEDTEGGCEGITGAAIPNSGDANNDGTGDDNQVNVRTAYNSQDFVFATVASESGAVREVTARSSTNPVLNLGTVAYAVDGLTPGASTEVELFFYSNNTPFPDAEYTAMKVNSEGELTPLANATVSEIIIDGQDVLKVTLTVTDGGQGDEDGVANGVILDPLALVQAQDLGDQPDNSNQTPINGAGESEVENDMPEGGLIRTGGVSTSFPLAGLFLTVSLALLLISRRITRE